MEECTLEDQQAVMRFLVDEPVKAIDKEMSPVYGKKQMKCWWRQMKKAQQIKMRNEKKQNEFQLSTIWEVLCLEIRT